MIGVDEVGRGCLAGPLLVVAARATAKLPSGLKDSKLLSRKQREEMLRLLRICCEFGEGWVSCKEIDQRGLTRALNLGGRRALNNLQALSGEEIVLDGNYNYLPKAYKNVRCLIDADALIPLVSAAGIYAKVQRDNFMIKLKSKHPAYGFETHMGYGTVAHREAMLVHGIIRGLHRLSFEPVRSIAQAL